MLITYVEFSITVDKILTNSTVIDKQKVTPAAAMPAVPAIAPVAVAPKYSI